eukprot:TRINITY_DN1237_c0_g1_i1.p1 TRINITY_DN1237_c0_g1~~TRINITY_DN1237_c0_g1_i1.p1  ORF type:complete len:97 (+),score=11.93 TRINITY_DN1237_c0_g1_i1:43-333(+)
MNEVSVDHVAIVNDDNTPVGTISSSQICSSLTSGRINADTEVNEIMNLEFKSIDNDNSLGDLSQYLSYNEVVVLTSGQTFTGTVSRRDFASYVIDV